MSQQSYNDYTLHSTKSLCDYDENDDTELIESLPVLNMITVERDKFIPNILETEYVSQFGISTIDLLF